MKLCSACLLGIRCGYDGKSNPHRVTIKLARHIPLIPVCPEQLGALPTPRVSSERIGEKVVTKSGRDVTRNFKKGGEAVLKIAKELGIKKAILKQRSPSCGCGEIYDGTFSGRLIRGDGVTAELLKKNNIQVISEAEL